MKKTLLILLLTILTANLNGAAFEDIGSVRARGMGDAFESVSAGIDSIHYNPAGTAYLNDLQVLTEYGKPALGFDDGSSFNSLHFGVSVPFSKKPYLIWLNYIFKGLTIGNEDKVIRDGSFSFVFHQFFVMDFAHQRLFTINFGKSLNNLLEGANIAVGANLNIFNMGFVMTEDMALHPDQPTDSTTGIGVDLGVTYDFSKYIRLSFVVANLLEPNVSFFKNDPDNPGDEPVNQQIRAGIGWMLGKQWIFHDLLATFGFVQINNDSEDDRPHPSDTIYKVGAEFWQWEERFAFRLGFKSFLNVITTGITYKHKFQNLHNIVFNYAFNFPLKSPNIKNYFSLNYEFDFPDYFFDYRTEENIQKQNEEIRANFDKGMVVKKYKTLPNDNLFNISIINYGRADRTDLIKDYNKIEDEEDLPADMEIPYKATSFILYEIKAGDTIRRVATRVYGDSENTEKMLRFNDFPYSKLRRGRVLIIPMSEEERSKYESKKDEWESQVVTEKDRKAEEEAQRKMEEEAAAKKKAEEDAAKKKTEEEEAKQKVEEEAAKKKTEEEAEKMEVEQPKPAPDTSSSDSSSGPTEIQEHEIVAGDNFSKISSKYYGSSKYWQKLADYNNIDPNKIQVGMKLKIPPLAELEKEEE